MSSSLNTLLELAERQRDEAMAAMMLAESSERRLRQQAEQLRAYRDDYHGRGPAQGGRSAPIELLRCHQSFMQRLEQAVQQQLGQLAIAEQHAAHCRQTLLEQETRVASVRKLLERRAEVDRQLADRADQRLTDEAAAQRHWRNAQQPAL